MSVTAFALTEHFARGHVQRGEQRGRAMSDVVVRDPLDVTEPQGQQGLRALQRLHLSFFVHAQHHRMIWWIQIQADDVANLLDEKRIAGQLERPLPVRLHAEQVEPALHRAPGHPAVLGYRARRPVRSARQL